MNEDRRQFGWLDANVLIHPLFENDPHGPPCRAVLEDILAGTAEGWLDCVTLHELTYALPRVLPETFPGRTEVRDYLLGFLTCDTLLCDDKETVIDTLCLWASSTLRFGDIKLAALARSRRMPVCTVNGRDFPSVTNTYRS